MNNPLFSSLPLPAFDQIQPGHFKEAFNKVFSEIEKQYLTLKQDMTPATFENSVLPFDTLFGSYQRLYQLLLVFYRNIRSEAIPALVKETNLTANTLTKRIFQDRELAYRFQTVYEKRSQLNLDDEDLWFLQNLYYRFEASGAFLSQENQQTLLELDAHLIQAAQGCFDNIMGAGRIEQAFLITDPEELSGLSKEKIDALERQAREKGHAKGWLFIPERLLVDELLEVAQHRGFRQKIHEAMNRVATEAPYDNEAGVKEVARLREQRAKLLGYEHFAHYQQSRNMAKSFERVEQILEESLKYLLPHFEEEMRHLEAWVASQKGPTSLEPWDVAYYSSQYKKQVLGFDAQELCQYLEFENVLQGWIQHASQSMNLEFSPYPQASIWDEEVRVFKVMDKDCHETSILYIDPFARSLTKDGGAWMSQIQQADKFEGRLNAILFNMNLTKAQRDQKTFLDKEQTATFYHEGGHALNGIKGQRAKYRSQKGTGNGSTFVEIHSIMQEFVPYTPQVLSTYAYHPHTHTSPSEALLKAMHKADAFLASKEALKLIQNAKRDLLLHSIPWKNKTSTQDIEAQASLNSRYSAHVRSYPLRRFDHLFSSALSQYAAGYCGYYLATLAQAVASQPFIEKGLYEPSLLEKQRAFYSIGAGLEPNQAYEAFTGEPLGNPIPYLKSIGIGVVEFLIY